MQDHCRGQRGLLPFWPPFRGGEKTRRQGKKPGLTAGSQDAQVLPQFPFCLALPLPASPHRAKEAFLSVVPTMPPLLRGAGPLPGASGVPIHVHTVLLALSPCSVLPGHSDTPPLSRGRNVVGASDAPSPAPSSWKKALPVHAMEGARRARPMAPPRVITPEGQQDTQRQQQPLRSDGRASPSKSSLWQDSPIH